MEQSSNNTNNISETSQSSALTIPSRAPYKMEVAIMAFLERSDVGMNSLEANREYGETCLHTSVSTLTHNFGIKFKHQPERIKNRAGTISRFTRYSLLSDGDVKNAQKLVNYFRLKRELAPIDWEAGA